MRGPALAVVVRLALLVPVGHYGLPGGTTEDAYLSSIMPYGLNLNLDIGVTAGDFPPVSRDVRASTSPLLPADAPRGLAALGLPERPTVAREVDLITGVPLVREVGLELPFGSRVPAHPHVHGADRLRGAEWYGTHRTLRSAKSGRAASGTGAGGWMISNPILLVDATWFGFVDPGAGG